MRVHQKSSSLPTTRKRYCSWKISVFQQGVTVSSFAKKYSGVPDMSVVESTSAGTWNVHFLLVSILSSPGSPLPISGFDPSWWFSVQNRNWIPYLDSFHRNEFNAENTLHFVFESIDFFHFQSRVSVSQKRWRKHWSLGDDCQEAWVHQHENLDCVTEMKIERPGNKMGHKFGENIQEDGLTQNKYVLDIPA